MKKKNLNAKKHIWRGFLRIGFGLAVLALMSHSGWADLAPGYIMTVAGNGNPEYSGDGGPAISAGLNYPSGIFIDREGNLFIVDSFNDRIRRVDHSSGTITTVAGGGYSISGDLGDGGLATNAIIQPNAVFVDEAGDLFISEFFHCRIRRVDHITGIITTVAGNGNSGYSGDGGLATSASLGGPTGVNVDGTGNLFIADSQNNRIRRVDHASGIITTVAGNGTFGYSGDGGPATNAKLADPDGINVDDAGNLFIVDDQNFRIRRVDHATGIITTVAGNGTPGNSGDGGPATSASLTPAIGVFSDGMGNLFITDTGNVRIRRVDHITGIITTVAGNGSPGYSGDGGPAISAGLNHPISIFVDGAGNLFFADCYNHRIRQVALFPPPGTFTISPSSGPAAGGTSVTIRGTNFLSGATVIIGGVRATSVVFINSTQLTAVTPAGTRGSQDVVVTNPDGQSVTWAGGFTYIAEPSILSVTPNIGPTSGGTSLTIAGNDFVSGAIVKIDGAMATSVVYVSSVRLTAATPPGTAGVKDLVVTNPDGQSGTLTGGFTYSIGDWLLPTQPGIIKTMAGTGVPWYSGENLFAITATLSSPDGLALDSSGDLLIADWGNHRILRINHQNGVVATIAGNGTTSYSGDNGLATDASFRMPTDIALDSSDNLFIADANDDRIRRVDHVTGKITTVAGNGVEGYSGEGGLAVNASLKWPSGITVGRTGDIFIADMGNSRVRRVDHATGQITTVVGNGIHGYSGDGGPATNASLGSPLGIVIDGSGNLIIADSDNFRVRRVDGATGVITTVAGNGRQEYSGDGGLATAAGLLWPSWVALDGAGDLYVSDQANHRVRRVDHVSGFITTVAGNGNQGFSGDLGLATNAKLSEPSGLALDSNGTLFIADRQNHRVRAVAAYLAPGPITINPNSGSTAGGTTVSISGSNFMSGATVRFAGNSATSTSFIDSSHLTAVTPPGSAGAKDVMVINPDGQTSTLVGGFTYILVPCILPVSPSSGPTSGGTTVTITGSNFASGATVMIGTISATSVVFVSSTQLTAVTPPGTAGAKDIVVTNPDGQSVTLAAGFTYLAPPGPFTIDPSSGPTCGGTEVTITGSNFAPHATVVIGGAGVNAIGYLNSTKIVVTTSEGTLGAKDVVVTNPDGQSATLAGGFNYSYVARPEILSVEPNSGPTAGGTWVLIIGSNFIPGATVKFGETPVTSIGFIGQRTISIMTPAGTAGAKDVIVTIPDGQSVTLRGGFTYVGDPQQEIASTGINFFDPNKGSAGEIKYELVQPASVSIVIYDRFGNEVLTLVNETRGAGPHVETWNGRNKSGEIVASGYYNVITRIGSQTKKLKMVVIK